MVFRRKNKHECLPTISSPKFAVPFVIRPFMGATMGLFVFFLGSFINSALSDVSTQSWATLPGRLSYIGLALLAGFGSQEFMERLKEVAKTTFSERIEDIEQEPAAQKLRLSIPHPNSLLNRLRQTRRVDCTFLHSHLIFCFGTKLTGDKTKDKSQNDHSHPRKS
jgi:hypothetical protein